MRNRQLLNLEYSVLADTDKLIGISKQLNAYDQIRNMVYMGIEQHNIMRQHSAIELTPVLILDEHTFMINVVKSSEIDELRKSHEYLVNAFDMLKHFSH